MNISLIGSGNVATQLGMAFVKAGHRIVEITARNYEAGISLARNCNARYNDNLKKLHDADVYIIAVKDDAISDVATQMEVEGKVVAHTSGLKPIFLLTDASSTHGVFYPLQTMSRQQPVNFDQVPIIIDGNDDVTAGILIQLARSISQKVYRAHEQQRQWIHLAAVFANNFTNHFYAIAEKLLNEQGISLEILYPLIAQTTENIRHHSPALLQTGPAVRGDFRTIDKHLQMLQDKEKLQALYRVVTESILLSHNT
ncbi:MAG: F420-dependent NADP oxidoreductase [Chitinophagales bacterium]|nr:F420-dependent NADP oxidoreductase [Chitinophagales bacterium]MDW8419016.1 DUF2520 domain-containing protein [Chitinophagales bacterium]